MEVPYLDLKKQNQAMRRDIVLTLLDVMDKTAFAGGPAVERFEKAFAAYCGSPYAIGVGSGTEALWLALLALRIGPGDEVITVPNTFIATVEAISFSGATPVFVDVDERTHTMDPGQFESAITSRTRAIIPVHLYGQAADMDPILKIAERNGLDVVEDACQAHGSGYKGRKAGTIGRIGCFSFYPGKNLGAYGEAGMVLTLDPEIADSIRWLRNHGQRDKNDHCCIGWNARMDGFQGAVLSVKLPYLDSWNDARRRIAGRYRELLGDIEEITLPYEAPYAAHNYHIFAVHTADPEKVIKKLHEKNISCGRHYPVPVHLQGAYQWMGLGQNRFPHAERNAREEISLPMYPELTDEQIEYVADHLRQVVRQPVFANR